MSENENINNSRPESDEINDKNSPNLIINLQDSVSSFNKYNNDDELMKSANNIILKPQFSSSSKYMSRNIESDLNNIYSSNSFNKNKFFSKSKINSISTEPESMVGFQSPSPKKHKKFSVFKMIEKSKNTKKNKYNYEENNKKKIDEEDTGRERKDINGTVIKKKNRKKIKISFADQINENNPLATIIDIESFKKYNVIYGMPKEEIIHKNVSSKCQCCNIF